MALTPSQRTTYKEEIARRLSGRTWAEIDLVLDEFGVGTADQWRYDDFSYVIEMLKGVADGSLTELAEHLGIETGKDTVFDIPEFWGEGTFRVFLSHLSAHKVYAAKIQAALSEFQIAAFVAHEDKVPTSSWQDEIEKALSTCEAMVALLHPNFRDSTWTDQEIGFGLGRGIPVFSVRLGTEPYGLFGRLQAFNGHNKEPRTIATELFDRYRVHPTTADKMAEIVVELFAESKNFNSSKERCTWLEQLTVWKPSFKARLREAVANNRQISDSWGVSARVEAVIEKNDPDESLSSGRFGADLEDDIPF